MFLVGIFLFLVTFYFYLCYLCCINILRSYSIMKKNITLIITLIFISLLLTSCMSSADGMKNEQRISVSAKGGVTLSPDIATFRVEADETRKTTSEALNAVNKNMATVLQILSSYKIADKDIATNSISLNPQYNWEDGKRVLIGQNASQSLSVKLRDIDQLGKIIDEISKITNINLYSINFDKEDKTEAYEEARILAVKNAIKKASTLANAADMELGEPLTINEGSSPYVSYDRANSSKMMVSEASSYNTQTPSGELTITSDVSVTFLMK